MNSWGRFSVPSDLFPVIGSVWFRFREWKRRHFYRRRNREVKQGKDLFSVAEAYYIEREYQTLIALELSLWSLVRGPWIRGGRGRRFKEMYITNHKGQDRQCAGEIFP